MTMLGIGDVDTTLPTMGVDVLTCDPVIDVVYKAGLLPLKDLRSLLQCLDSQEVLDITQEHARQRIQQLACSLHGLALSSQVFAARVRSLIWDLENRMVQLEVPMWAVHPSLETPLVQGQLTPMGMYDDLMGVGTALRVMTHPAAWHQLHDNIWDTVAASASLLMRPCLALMLSAIIPVEARLSYVTLRHAAYADAVTTNLGQMLAKILMKMMMYEVGPKDQQKVTKHLKQVGFSLSPFTLFLLRTCASCRERCLDQRAADRERLAPVLRSFLEQQGDSVLYCRKVWTRFLLGLDPKFLVAFYVKFLYDGFQ